MRNARVWARVAGVEGAVVEGVRLDEARDAVVVSVRPRSGARRRCGACGAPSPGYDGGAGRRRWRTLDAVGRRCYLEAEAPRVRCAEHGVVVARVPWARHGAGHTRAFDDAVAWLAARCSKSAVVELMRVAWRSVGAVVERVVADASAGDPLDGLERIGVDEVSYRRGHRYLTVVVDHDRGRVVWVEAGKDKATLGRFFEALGPERCSRLRLVSADAADWVPPVLARHCPQARLCIDPFHVVAWAGRALDQVRRQVWNRARRAGRAGEALRVKRARFALRRRPGELDDAGRGRVAEAVRLSGPLHRAWLLTHALRDVYAAGGEEGVAMLSRWLAWARRCRIPEMVAVARRVARHRDGIESALRHGLSNGRVESVNAKIRLLTRVAYGFHSAGALIALVKLSLCGYCPPLPLRAHT